MRHLQSRPKPERQAKQWNDSVKVGDTVEYRGYPEADPQICTTRTDASVLNGHTAVVWLNEKAGCVAVSACRPVKG